MPVITPPTPPPLYPRQHAAIYDPARIVVIEASTKSGKTAGCLHWGYSQAVKSNNNKGLWLEPTYTMARDIGYSRLVRMLQGCDPRKRIWSCSDSALEVRFVNGSMVRFKGGDNADGIYGEDYDWAVIDEGTRCSEESWHAVRSTLTATRGPCRIIGNVRGRKNWVYRLGAMARAGEAGMSYHRLTAYDAVDGGVLDRKEVDDAERLLPRDVFRQLYLAEPADDGGNPFGIDAIRAAVLTEQSAMEPEVWGIDLAKHSDWTVAYALDAHGHECQVHRWQADWDATERRLERLIGDTPALCDATGVGDPVVERLQRRLPNIEGFVFTSKSKQQLMEGLAGAISAKDIRVHDPIVVGELEAFEYEFTRTGVRYSAPEGMHDDCVCALALAVQHRAASVSNRFTFRVF